MEESFVKRLPKTVDGFKTECLKRSNWNGKSMAKNARWLLMEIQRQKKYLIEKQLFWYNQEK